MQTFADEHEPDWHLDASVKVHPCCPFAKPHLLFDPQTLITHCFALVQVALLESAQVFSDELHRPVMHTDPELDGLQVPV